LIAFIIDIDPRPNAVRMAATFLFMKDDGAGLIGQPEFVFNLGNGVFKNINWNAFSFRRIKAERKKELLALRAATDGVSLVEGSRQIIRNETAQLLHGHMVIVPIVQ
jgi:hypothetical protein